MKKKLQRNPNAWEAAKELSDSLQSLLGLLSVSAKNQDPKTDKAKHAQDLAETLAKLENTKTAAVSKQDLDDLFKDLDSLVVSADKPPPVSMKEAKTFEDVMEAAAHHVRAAAKKTKDAMQDDGNDPLIVCANKIGQQLAETGAAAKSGSRQGIIVGTRSINSLIVNMEKCIKSLNAQTRDPKLRERLQQASDALRNYGTQLKILSAVKAAGKIGGSQDTEEQLLSVSKSLGYALENILILASEAHLKEKRAPKK